MEKVGIPNNGGPIGQMLLEHNQGRQHIAKMAAAIENGTLQAGRFDENAESYIRLMRAHIEKENSVLFPAGERLLPMNIHGELLDRFEVFEEEAMGQETYVRLNEVLHRLEHKYLKMA